MIAVAMGRRPSSPSDSVSTETSTSPPLITDVCTPGGTPSSGSLQLFGHFLCGVNLQHTTKDGSAGGKKLRQPTKNVPGIHRHQPATCVKANKYEQCCNSCPQHSYRALGAPKNGIGFAGTGRVVNRNPIIPWLWYTVNHSQEILMLLVSSPIIQVSELLSHPLFTVDLQNLIPECRRAFTTCPTPQK